MQSCGRTNSSDLIICFAGDPKSSDPIYATDVRSGKLCALLYDNLVQFDTKANIIPALAHNWIITNNGKTYTFNIRHKVEFNNGTVLNTDIIKHSFERISNKSLYNNIESIIADTDSTIIFNLNKTNNKNRFFPIVFICNTQHSKMISEIRKTSLELNKRLSLLY